MTDFVLTHNENSMDGTQLCEFCGDVFGANEFVIHTYNNGLLDGPYLCELCGDGFNSRCQVDLHNKEQHLANMCKKIRKEEPCSLNVRNQLEHSTVTHSSSSSSSSSSRNSVSGFRTPSQTRVLSQNRPLFLEARAHASFMPRQNVKENQASQHLPRPLFLDAKSFASLIPSDVICDSKSTDYQSNVHSNESRSQLSEENIFLPIITNQETCLLPKEKGNVNDKISSGNSLDKFLQGTEVGQKRDQGDSVDDAQIEDKLILPNFEIQMNVREDKQQTENESQAKVFEEKSNSTLQEDEFEINDHSHNDKLTLQGDQSLIKDNGDIIKEIDMKPVICNICKVAFSSTDEITVHIDCFHGNYPYKCVICYSVYLTFTEINEHLKNEHNFNQENTSESYLNTGQISVRKELQFHSNILDTDAVANVNQDCRDLIRNMSETVKCSTETDFNTDEQVGNYMVQIDNVVGSCVSSVVKDPKDSHQIPSAVKIIQVVVPKVKNCVKTSSEIVRDVKRTRGRKARIMNRQMINVDDVTPSPVIFYTCAAICFMCSGEKSVRFGCLICPKIFFTCTEVMYHQNNEHKKEIYGGKDKNMSRQTCDGVSIHACNACNAIFCNLEGLIGHDLDNHLQITQFKCKISRQEFKTKEEFFTHFKLSIMKNLASTCPVIYINNKKYLSTNLNFCPICGSSILDYTHFKTHVQRLHVGVPQQLDCWVCGDSLCGEPHKVDHMAILHKDHSSYICILCNLSFSSIDDLRSHHDNTHNHHGIVFACSVCNSTVKCSYMKQHYKVDHGMNKIYECKFCNNVFLNVSERKLHHHKIHCVHENYKCHICQEKLANFQHFHLHFHSQHVGNFRNSFNIVANLVYSFSA